MPNGEHQERKKAEKRGNNNNKNERIIKKTNLMFISCTFIIELGWGITSIPFIGNLKFHKIWN